MWKIWKNEDNDSNQGWLRRVVTAPYRTATRHWNREESLVLNVDKQGSNRYEAVQIFRPTFGSNRFELNKQALERILLHSDVAEKPVAVYSLAGAFRKGKSFMLNFFLLYLQSGRSNQWLANKEAEINRGFVSRGGKNKCTEGIWMWNEPFSIDTKNGELIIFLLDTQGTFDYDSSMNKNLSIFSLSTLISSSQIFNIMNRIEESDLHHLQLFLEYGKLMSTGQNKSENTPFQHLMFLIRDWSDPDYCGIEGGRNIFEDVFKIRKENEDSQSVRESITTLFERVGCYLMPKPGYKVEVRRASDPPLKIGEVSDGFLEEVDKLAQYLFKDNVTAKCVNGNVVTGRDLINFIIAYGELFEGGSLPEVEPIMKASAKAAMLTTIRTCKNKYNNEMEKLCNPGYIKPKRLNEMHEQCKDKVLKKFDELPKLGEQEFILQYQEFMLSSMDQDFSIYRQRNIAYQKKMENEVCDYITEADARYSAKLEELSEQCYVDDARLERNEQISKKGALKFYEESVANFDDEITLELREKLYKLLLQSYNQYLESNRQRKMELERTFSKVSENAKKIYCDKMNQTCGGYYLESQRFIQAHEQFFQRALAFFDSSNIRADASMINEKKSNLEKRLYQLKIKYEKDNQINKKLEESKILEIISQANKTYTNLMQKSCGDSYKSIEFLDREHEKCKKEATKILESFEKEKGKIFANKCSSNLVQEFEASFERVKQTNEFLKMAVLHKLGENAKQALNTYQKCMDEKKISFVIEVDLEEHHKTARSLAIQIYIASGKVEPIDKYESIMNDLEKDITTHYQIVKDRNEHNKEIEKGRAEQSLEDIVANYIKIMKALIGNAYVEPEVLSRVHDAFKDESMERFVKHTNDLFPEMSTKLGKTLTTQLQVIKDENAKNEPWFITKIVKSIADVCCKVVENVNFVLREVLNEQIWNDFAYSMIARIPGWPRKMIDNNDA